ncbi:aspartyl-tRNA(Asn)/glutamyl-tRNA(Gln) amidotransferase subunit C [Clostridium acetobutylicum]|uniref:Glutamyl-tRNA(Gln) amidotransferase subunit C 2 n=1 Tax=Clostridium acetobutylicum (strain ATCC 824 / DSM 792 / JCM 1419 / IAM 19013 / LMG 5710 / NBRC 13948 / NRRL B-527 / VKM B-1787 / 2291 / W) TaxID=272562 RepID=GATC2_CLOAB|nr:MULTISPECIES: Asp-tRNA(Asn)/Glu-tRNA(Gln) amidotransferase subunit GatC [Clostridium]Q97EX7.1 RecName: Full=Glutamyl-tRNA(Gln) amidotransferase subunit C 2; Short=Glu-ADT subunit C 2 [Clostridium acetobutylicum ATCC 824]AAK80920.1 Glu-tRNA amidotransferase, subunit C [Clostridium acetobutylicum ATCC 824]ADZ22022.1 Glu-tRNA amidotransferase, subunit C [Clostridium acetobutylicum EA 2018]AEI34698.1 Glu-tRNA amidotransferase, subunit C [Clostridium acetobutylicum DSM 1731]AWV78668.1 Asp-tRNA(A
MSDKHVDIDTVKYISKLSKLKFTDNEAKKLAGEFEAILGHFETIDKVDLSDINVNEFDEVNTEFRKDVPKVFEDKKKLMQNVKSLRDGAIEVPKIIE